MAGPESGLLVFGLPTGLVLVVASFRKGLLDEDEEAEDELWAEDDGLVGRE